MAVTDELFDKLLSGKGNIEDLVDVMENGISDIEKQLKIMVDGLFLAKKQSSLKLSDVSKNDLQHIVDKLAFSRMEISCLSRDIQKFKQNQSFSSEEENGL